MPLIASKYKIPPQLSVKGMASELAHLHNIGALSNIGIRFSLVLRLATFSHQLTMADNSQAPYSSNLNDSSVLWHNTVNEYDGTLSHTSNPMDGTSAGFRSTTVRPRSATTPSPGSQRAAKRTAHPGAMHWSGNASLQMDNAPSASNYRYGFQGQAADDTETYAMDPHAGQSVHDVDMTWTGVPPSNVNPENPQWNHTNPTNAPWRYPSSYDAFGAPSASAATAPTAPAVAMSPQAPARSMTKFITPVDLDLHLLQQGTNRSKSSPGVSQFTSATPDLSSSKSGQAGVQRSWAGVSVKSAPAGTSASSAKPHTPIMPAPLHPQSKKSQSVIVPSNPGEASAPAEFFSYWPTLADGLRLSIPPDERAQLLLFPRDGHAWELWEKGDVIDYLAGSNAPHERFQSAMNAPKDPQDESTLSEEWYELSSIIFNGTRGPHMIVHAWWNICEAWRHIHVAENFTGGGHGDYNPAVTGSIGDRLSHLRHLNIIGHGIQGWEADIWMSDPQNGWYALLSNRLKDHPNVIHGGDFRSCAIPPLPASGIQPASMEATNQPIRGSTPGLPPNPVSTSSSFSSSPIVPKPAFKQARSHLSQSSVAPQEPLIAPQSTLSTATVLELARGSSEMRRAELEIMRESNMTVTQGTQAALKAQEEAWGEIGAAAQGLHAKLQFLASLDERGKAWLEKFVELTLRAQRERVEWVDKVLTTYPASTTKTRAEDYAAALLDPSAPVFDFGPAVDGLLKVINGLPK